MSIKLYNFLQIILSPIIFIYFLYRLIIGKEHKARFKERLGKTPVARPSGPLIWFHCASIGEAVSILNLIDKIFEKYPQLNILVTTGTVTSAKLLASKMNKKAIHQFIPIDFNFAVKRFLAHWRPDFAVWVESELWPNLVYQTAQTGSPLALVNARISQETKTKWQKHKKFAKQIFESFSVCLAQNEAEQENYSQLGIKSSINAGNLKFESAVLPADPEELANVIKMIGERTIWLCASSNEGEEEIAANCHKYLKDSFEDILTIIVPRHPNRAKDIEKLISSKGLSCAVRSKQEKVFKDTDIYLCDTIGELGVFYRISNIVFIGGSLVKHGGQNPLEPARLNCALISGNYTYNFAEIYRQMQEYQAVQIVDSQQQLIDKLKQLLQDIKLQDLYSNRALEFVNSRTGILENYLNLLDPYLKPLGKPYNH